MVKTQVRVRQVWARSPSALEAKDRSDPFKAMSNASRSMRSPKVASWTHSWRLEPPNWRGEEEEEAEKKIERRYRVNENSIACRSESDEEL